MSTEKEIVVFWDHAFEAIEPFAIKLADIATETDALSQEVLPWAKKPTKSSMSDADLENV